MRVHAASINRLDIEFRQTGFGFAGPDFPFPHVGGADAAGTVDAVGYGVASVRRGERVVVFPFIACGRCANCLTRQPENTCLFYQLLGIQRWGGYAEYVVVPEHNVIPLPDPIPFEQATCLPVSYVTAWHGLVNRAAVGPGDRVVVMGATSATGVAAVQIARARGARVVGVGRSEWKLARLREVGADGVVSLQAADWPALVRESLGGRATVLFDTLGAVTWAHVQELVERGARVAVCGRSSGTELATNLLWLYRNVTTVFFYLSGQRRDLEAVVAAVASRLLSPVIDRVFPLEELARAQQVVADGGSFGKVVVWV